MSIYIVNISMLSIMGNGTAFESLLDCGCSVVALSQQVNRNAGKTLLIWKSIIVTYIQTLWSA